MKIYLYLAICLGFIATWGCQPLPTEAEPETTTTNTTGTAWTTNYQVFYPPYNFSLAFTNIETNLVWGTNIVTTNIRMDIPMTDAFSGQQTISGTDYWCMGYFSASNASNGWGTWNTAMPTTGFVGIWNDDWITFTNSPALGVKIIIYTQ